MEKQDDRRAYPKQTEWRDQKTDMGALEAVLFSMGEPVSLNVLAEAIGRTPSETGKLLKKMMDRMEDPASGMQILELDGSFQMTTKKQYYENLIRVASHPPKPRLTEVVMETLSIIAYKQPVTKAEIERIRGVSSDHAVNRLIEYGLVEEAGRLDAPGRPMLFVTTDRFLRYFGLSSAKDLPEMDSVRLEDFREEAEEEADRELEAPEKAGS